MSASSLRRHYPGQVQRVSDDGGRPLSLASQAPPVPYILLHLYSITLAMRCQAFSRNGSDHRQCLARGGPLQAGEEAVLGRESASAQAAGLVERVSRQFPHKSVETASTTFQASLQASGDGLLRKSATAAKLPGTPKKPPVCSDWRHLRYEPRGNRTPNPLIKSQLLCLIELAAHGTGSLYLVRQTVSNLRAFQGQSANHRMNLIRHTLGTML